MSRLHLRHILLLAGAMLATAGPAQAGFSDPVGDTFNTGTHDIIFIDAQLWAGTIRFTVTFNGPISAPSAFAADSVVGFIDIDVDENAATGGSAPWGGPVVGGNSWINFFIPPNPGTPSIPGPLVALGDEFFIDIGSELFHPGFVDVIDTGTNSVASTVAITFGGSFFDVFVDLSTLNDNNARVNFGAILGDFNSPTDRAPNGANPFVSTVPEPQSMYMLLTGCGSLLAYGWRRNRLRKQA